MLSAGSMGVALLLRPPTGGVGIATAEAGFLLVGTMAYGALFTRTLRRTLLSRRTEE